MPLQVEEGEAVRVVVDGTLAQLRRLLRNLTQRWRIILLVAILVERLPLLTALLSQPQMVMLPWMMESW